SLVVYEREYCDVRGLVLVEMLDQHPENDREGEAEQLDVFCRPIEADAFVLLQNY
ncbi:hypothetical protein A2U01_0098877, partial [Trifolium medium]|nr:hypothetical protein [Trifolium medium]